MSTYAETPWAPLRHPAFRALWLATFASNVGTLVQNVGAAWLMTSLAPSPLLVALVQTANTLPVFLLALLAGALADVLDRRKLLLATQGWMCAISFLLAILTLQGRTSPALLLGLTFALGLGAALNAPAWQAIVSDLVPRDELPSAVALNSMGLNLARAVAPAMGGVVVAAMGPGAAFLLNSMSFVGVLAVLFRWKRPVRESRLPAEHVREAVYAGIRYVRYAPNVRAVLVRTGAFIFFGSAIWALLPVLSRFELGMGPVGYGLLMGCLGGGAVAGALVLSELRQHMPLERMMAAGTVLYGLGTLVPALVHQRLAICLGMAGAGLAWLVMLATLNSSVQAGVPAWVRGRAMAAYLLVAFGAQAVGAALWGGAVDRLGLSGTFGVCGVGVLACLALQRRFPLGSPDAPAPDAPCELPVQALAWRHEAGGIQVCTAYRIAPESERAFREVMRELRRVRLRNGATRWELVGDRLQPGRFVERFEAASGTDLLRLYERMTGAETEVERQAWAFHVGPEAPRVTTLRSEASDALATDG